jgi:hypothetical protein
MKVKGLNKQYVTDKRHDSIFLREPIPKPVLF